MTRADLPGRAPSSRPRVPAVWRRWTRSLGNLPVQVTSFVGRDDDVARIVALLDDASLVTLTGTGGVGKTRLAVQAAAQVVRASPTEAGCASSPRSPTATRWPKWCRQRSAACNGPICRSPRASSSTSRLRELLLVLDNCEHLLDDAGAFADAVMRSCPTRAAWSRRAARRSTWPASASCGCGRCRRPRRPPTGAT